MQKSFHLFKVSFASFLSSITRIYYLSAVVHDVVVLALVVEELSSIVFINEADEIQEPGPKETTLSAFPEGLHWSNNFDSVRNLEVLGESSVSDVKNPKHPVGPGVDIDDEIDGVKEESKNVSQEAQIGRGIHNQPNCCIVQKESEVVLIVAEDQPQRGEKSRWNVSESVEGLHNPKPPWENDVLAVTKHNESDCRQDKELAVV